MTIDEAMERAQFSPRELERVLAAEVKALRSRLAQAERDRTAAVDAVASFLTN